MFTIATIIVLYRIKYEVQALEILKTRLQKEITGAKEALHVLKAEWSHVNDPKKLQKLSEKFLPHLKPVTSSQLITLQDMIQTNGVRTESDENLEAYFSEILKNEIEGSKPS